MRVAITRLATRVIVDCLIGLSPVLETIHGRYSMATGQNLRKGSCKFLTRRKLYSRGNYSIVGGEVGWVSLMGGMLFWKTQYELRSAVSFA